MNYIKKFILKSVLQYTLCPNSDLGVYIWTERRPLLKRLNMFVVEAQRQRDGERLRMQSDLSVEDS